MKEGKGKSSQQRGGGNVQGQSDTNQAFVQHLQRASTVVKTWPAWKQQILGAVFTQESGGENIQTRR